jgi:hypothetical protein
MSERGRPPTDEIRTEIYDSHAGRTNVVRPEDDEATEKTAAPQRAARSTAKGHGRPGGTSNAPESVRRSEPMRAQTPPRGDAIIAISLKTPAEIAEETKKKSVKIRKPNLRSIGEISGTHTPPQGLGFLAPPRDASAARTRRTRSNVSWVIAALAIAVVVAVSIWLLSTRW